MDILSTIIIYGIACSFLISIVVLAQLWYNPRLLLQDYPKDVQQQVPPKTPAEKRVSTYWAVVLFLLMLAFPLAAALSSKAAHHSFLEVFLSAFGVLFLFNLVDLLVMDWLIVCTITPKFLVIPGTEGMAGYKNYAMHFKGLLIGTGVSVVLSLLFTTLVMFL
ncbi:MAG TPA: hypothetical protein VFB12_01615 [Ktedonobacteraceae bacterium]|nr:hypothetical protein [Ktedonobacteraceae bacterium]